MERELHTDQDALANFQRTNNMAILQEQGTIAGGYLEKLQTELSDLQLESQLLKATEEEQKGAVPGDIAPAAGTRLSLSEARVPPARPPPTILS